MPGTLVAKKKVLKKFAGNVHFTSLTGDFESSGTSAEYLTAQPGTYRRAARGVETLHVQMFNDNPADGVFTYVPGGTEDLPVLDAANNPISELMTVTVAASIKNIQKDSTRYYNPCTILQHIENSTALMVDCRCHTNVVGLDFPECKATIANYLNMSFGAGPRAQTQNEGEFISRFTEPATDELIAILGWKDHETRWPENNTYIDVGAVVAINANTGDRRIIGGRYKHPNGIQDHGTGPVLSYPFQVQKGPDACIILQATAT